MYTELKEADKVNREEDNSESEWQAHNVRAGTLGKVERLN